MQSRMCSQDQGRGRQTPDGCYLPLACRTGICIGQKYCPHENLQNCKAYSTLGFRAAPLTALKRSVFAWLGFQCRATIPMETKQ